MEGGGVRDVIVAQHMSISLIEIQRVCVSNSQVLQASRRRGTRREREREREVGFYRDLQLAISNDTTFVVCYRSSSNAFPRI